MNCDKLCEIVKDLMYVDTWRNFQELLGKHFEPSINPYYKHVAFDGTSLQVIYNEHGWRILIQNPFGEMKPVELDRRITLPYHVQLLVLDLIKEAVKNDGSVRVVGA